MDSKTFQLLQRDLSNGSKKSASIFPPQEALLKFILEYKNTKSIAFHDFTHFCIGTTRKAVLPNDFLGNLFLWRSYNLDDGLMIQAYFRESTKKSKQT
jgi:hypothetical protein